MERNGQHLGVLGEDRLCTVAVMDVPVDDRHLADPDRSACMLRRDRDVVEDAEPHAGLGDRMVACWVDEGVSVVDGPRHDRLGHRNR